MNDKNAPEWWIRPCSECRHWERYGTEKIGTCRVGGPTSDEACADTGANETCGKWETKK